MSAGKPYDTITFVNYDKITREIALARIENHSRTTESVRSS